MRAVMQQEFKERMREARGLNATEGQPDRIWSDIFTEARR
jgi:hypothetical protein